MLRALGFWEKCLGHVSLAFRVELGVWEFRVSDFIQAVLVRPNNIGALIITYTIVPQNHILIIKARIL